MTDRVRESKDQEIENTLPERKRVPLREQARNKLTVRNPDKNYVYRIVNDTDDNVERRKLAGWEIAPESVGFGDMGKNQSLGSGSRINVGGGITAILMRTRKEYVEEDQAYAQRERDNVERNILRTKNREDGLEGEIESAAHSRKVYRNKQY